MTAGTSSTSHKQRYFAGFLGGYARRFYRALCIAAMLVLVAGGCGSDDVPSVSGQTRPKRARGKRAKPGNPNPNANSLNFYTKIEDLIDAEEAGRIRHRFSPADFVPDVTGNRNRDPFRSYVVLQPGIAQLDESDAPKIIATDLCRELVANNFSLRDLRLVAIVLRGTRSYAMFMDSTSEGHIVTKGDCLGQEKARVSSVRAGFVSLEVRTDTGQGLPASTSQERIIPLYPDELTVDGEQ